MKRSVRNTCCLFLLVLLPRLADAQTNLQLFYDFGRGFATSTFEMYKADNWGDSFFFIDHYYATRSGRDNHLGSAANGSYFEIERGLNFWKDSKLKDFYIHVEYDGSTWGSGLASLGAKYAFHNSDFSKTASVALMYDCNIGQGKANLPFKFTAVWGVNDLFGIQSCRFSGFFDLWGNNSQFYVDQFTFEETYFSLLTEPQLWMNLASIGIPNLNVGGEVELSYNFAGNKGFMCNPCLGVKWVF